MEPRRLDHELALTKIHVPSDNTRLINAIESRDDDRWFATVLSAHIMSPLITILPIFNVGAAIEPDKSHIVADHFDVF